MHAVRCYESKESTHDLRKVLLLYRLPTLTSSLPHNLDIEKYPHLRHLELHHIPCDGCDMLIASDSFHLHAHRDFAKSPNSMLIGVEMDLGWTIMGSEHCTDADGNEQLFNTVSTSNDTYENLE